MFNAPILGSARRAFIATAAMAALAGCGQRGPLYLPTEPAAAGRLTLPEVLFPTSPGNPTPPLGGQVTPGGSGTGSAPPVRTP